MFRKSLSIILSLLMILLFVACTPPENSDVPPVVPEEGTGPGTDTNPGEKTIRLSVTAKRQKPSSRAIMNEKGSIIPEELLLPSIMGKEPVKTLTPTYFIMNIPSISVYEPKDLGDIEKGWTRRQYVNHRVSGDTMNMVNFLVDRGMPSMTLPSEDEFFAEPWNGIFIHCSGFIGGFNPAEGYDEYYGGSFIGVRLPEGIDIGQVENARSSSEFERGNFFLDPELAWFSWPDLIPHIGKHINAMCFQTGLDTVKVINPEGKFPPEGELHHFGPTQSSGNSSCLALPLEAPLDFGKYDNPEIEIEYDTEDLITLYDLGNGKYRATFNVSDPYPFSIDIDEYDPDEIVLLNDDQREQNIIDAKLLGAIRARRPENVIGLTFIKPNYDDIDHVEIWHSVKDDVTTAEMIWAGTDNAFNHVVEDVFDENHHYWGYVVNEEGEKSAPVKFLPAIYGKGNGGGGNGGGGNGGHEIIPNGRLFMTARISHETQPTDAGKIIRANLEATGKINFDEPVLKFTPAHFFTQIQDIHFYEPVDGKDPMQGCVDEAVYAVEEEFINHMNIDLLDPTTSVEFRLNPEGGGVRNHGWTGAGMSISGPYRVELKDQNTIGTTRGTLLGIPKSAVPEGVVFDNAVEQKWIDPAKGPWLDETKNDFIWFRLDHLVMPTGVMLERFIWHGGVESGTYHNSQKQEGDYKVGCFMDRTIRSTASIKPKARLKLEDPANDTLVLAVNPTELIWAYKTNDGKYHAVLNLDNPFPIQLEIKSSN